MAHKAVVTAPQHRHSVEGVDTNRARARLITPKHVYIRRGAAYVQSTLNFPFLASEDHLAGFHMQQAFRITLFNCYRFSHQSASIWRIEYDVFYLALHRIGLHCTMLYNERLQSCGWQIECFKKVEIYCH